MSVYHIVTINWWETNIAVVTTRCDCFRPRDVAVHGDVRGAEGVRAPAGAAQGPDRPHLLQVATYLFIFISIHIYNVSRKLFSAHPELRNTFNMSHQRPPTDTGQLLSSNSPQLQGFPVQTLVPAPSSCPSPTRWWPTAPTATSSRTSAPSLRGWRTNTSASACSPSRWIDDI